MSRATKAALITAVIFILIGLVFILAAVLSSGFDIRSFGVKFEKNTYTVTESFDSININEIECDVRLVPSQDGECRIICTESENMRNTIGVIDGTLTVTRVDTREWFAHIGIWIEKDMSLTVYLPESKYKTLKLKAVSGNITAGDDFSFSDASVKTTSGDISFTSNADNVSVISTSGDVVLKNAKGAVFAKTTSGELDLSDIAADTLEVKTTSGDIEINSATAENTASLKAVSGDIELERFDAREIIIDTVSGNAEATLLSGKQFETHTVSGDIKVPESDYDAGLCKISTTSGNVRVMVKQ